MSAAAEPVRLTPTQRQHEALMALINRAPRTGQDDLELGESAQGRAYVKSLHLYRDGETREEWVAQSLALFAALREGLPEATVAPVSPSEAPTKVRSRGKP